MTRKKTSPIVIYVFLAVALGSFFLPMIQVTLPAVGEKSWSLKDVVSSLPMPGPPAKERKPGWQLKADFDFFDVLMKILPQSSETGEPKKFSLTFLLGILVPVALLVSYGLALLNFLVALLKKKVPLVFSSGLGAGCALYALGGTYYLGIAAQRAFAQGIEKASEGIFGMIAKNFVEQITIRPDSGLFVLAASTGLAFLTSLLRKR